MALRLSESSPAFIARKAGLELRKKLDRASTSRAARDGQRFSGGYEEAYETVLERARTIREDTLRNIELLTASGTGELSTSAVRASLVGEFDKGVWHCLGYGQHELIEGSWHRDAFHDHAWPSTYFAEVDFVARGVRADVKVPWEKSRLQWLASAALGNRFEPEEHLRAERQRKLLALLEDWFTCNPYGMGVNWVSAMEVAIRAVNLMTALVFLADRIEEHEVRSILKSAGEHLRYLRRFPETSDVPGNHYLATELGIFVLEALCAPTAEELAPASREFLRACHGQFAASGLHIENAPLYHRLSMDMVVLGQALIRRLSPRESRELEPLLQRAMGAAAALSNAAGELPLFGDNDTGKVLDLGQDTRAFDSYPEWVWEGGSPAAASRGLGQQLHAALLAGFAGAPPGSPVSMGSPEFTAPTEERPATVAPFVVLRCGDAKLVARAGELGLAGRASHDHDDQLSFWYSRGERDLIVEAGCAPYTLDASQRARNLSSAAHNVVQARGMSRFQPGAGSVCATVRGGPRATVTGGAEGERPWTSLRLVGGDGPAFSGCPVLHERRLELDEEGALRIDDRVQVESAEGFESRLHVAPGLELRVEPASPVAVHGEQVAWVDGPGCALRISVRGPAGLTLESSRYVHHPAYGAELEAACLVIRRPGAVCVEYSIRVEEAEAEVEERVVAGAEAGPCI